MFISLISIYLFQPMSARQFFFEFCYESSYRDALWDLINSNSNIINFF